MTNDDITPVNAHDSWQRSNKWPALRSALAFAEERINTMRHTEAVADCDHCNFAYIIAWVKEEIGSATPDALPTSELTQIARAAAVSAWRECNGIGPNGKDILDVIADNVAIRVVSALRMRGTLLTHPPDMWEITSEALRELKTGSGNRAAPLHSDATNRSEAP